LAAERRHIGQVWFLLFVFDEVIRPMTFRHLRRIKLTTLFLAFAGLGACVAPILTVPPPGASEIAFTSTAIAEVDGGADAGGVTRTVWIAHGGPLPSAALATYYLRNRTLEEGVFATAAADGSFTSPDMDGTTGDPIQIYYVTPAGDYSESICVLLRSGSLPLSACPE
jgi:hypothetical protein